MAMIDTEHKAYGSSFHVERDAQGVIHLFRDGVELIDDEIRLDDSEMALLRDFVRVQAWR